MPSIMALFCGFYQLFGLSLPSCLMMKKVGG
jgi:hypothetical protein